MKKVFLLLLLWVSFGFCGEKFLHVSTIPAHADIFIGSTTPDYSRFPNAQSPAFVPADTSENQVFIAIFHPGFADTLISVNLSKKDTSYLIVSLRPLYDDDKERQQHRTVSRRSLRSIGHGLMWASIAPLAVTAVSSAITVYQIDQAENARKILKNSSIAIGDNYAHARQDFKDARSKANTAKKVTIGSAIGAAALLAAGFIISF